jgi:integrase
LVSTITLADVELGFFAAWESELRAPEQEAPERRHRASPTGCAAGHLFDFFDRFDLLIGTDGSIIRNPLSSLEIPSAATPRRDHLSPAAAGELVAAARMPWQKIVVALLLGTGMRAGEAAALADDDLDLDRREIRVRASKTPRGRRTIPLLPQLQEPVREWRRYRERASPEQAARSIPRDRRRATNDTPIHLEDRPDGLDASGHPNKGRSRGKQPLSEPARRSTRRSPLRSTDAPHWSATAVRDLPHIPPCD